MDYGKVKEILKDFNTVFKDRRAVSKIISFLDLVQFVLFLCVLFVRYWNFFDYINLPILPIFDNNFRINLYHCTLSAFIFVPIYFIFLKPFVEYIIINAKVKFKLELFPLLHTVEDVFGIIFSFIFVIYFLNSIILYIHGYGFEEGNESIFTLYFYLLLFRIFCWLYAKNKKRWDCIEKKYTPYFDCEEKRIPEKGKVIYNGKLYKVILVEEKDDNLTTKRKWCLSENMSGSTKDYNVLLEAAVKDEKGKIKIYQYGMGEEA